MRKGYWYLRSTDNYNFLIHKRWNLFYSKSSTGTWMLFIGPFRIIKWGVK